MRIEINKDIRSKKQIVDHYGLNKSTLSTWLKKADDIKSILLISYFSAMPKKLLTAMYTEEKAALLKWFKISMDNNNVPVSGPFHSQVITTLYRAAQPTHDTIKRLTLSET